MSNFIKLAVVACTLLLSACSTSIDDYKNTTPELNFKDFFSGELAAYGIVQDYSGEVTRRFSVDMQATWQGNTLTLDEQFYYADGEQSERIWTIELNADNSITGTAGDVIGQATGQIQGNALYWQYTLEIPYDGDTLQVNLDDWMYLVTPTRLINRTAIDKFGFEVGEITLVIEKR